MKEASNLDSACLPEPFSSKPSAAQFRILRPALLLSCSPSLLSSSLLARLLALTQEAWQSQGRLHEAGRNSLAPQPVSKALRGPAIARSASTRTTKIHICPQNLLVGPSGMSDLINSPCTGCSHDAAAIIKTGASRFRLNSKSHLQWHDDVVMAFLVVGLLEAHASPLFGAR